MPVIPAAVKQSIRALAAQNNSAAEIGAKLDMGRNSVIGICHRNGIKLPGKRKHGQETKYPNWNGGTQPRQPAPRMPSGKCRYPHGDPKAPDFHFCEARVDRIGSPYCAKHRAVCYTRPAVAA